MFLIKWIFKIIFKVLVFVLVWVIFFMTIFNWPVKDKNEEMEFNISFSNIFAEEIGLDWKKVYIEMLDDLKPKKIRIAAYWDRIETEPGQYDFSDLDWQVSQAQQRNTEIVLALGIKVPRWPECFIPEFYINNKEEREEALLKYEEKIIERYKDYLVIKYWQVENEPFLAFGNCIEGAIDEDLLDREIELVKSLDDSRSIITTDSGELSYWYEAAKRGDIFGTTLYRTIYKEPFGYINYPIGPNFFRMKAKFIKYFANQENVIISELQAEPWGPKNIAELSIDEQYKSMNPTSFVKIIDYAQKTNFSESYLWGVEWWYWLKEKEGKNEMWEEVKKVIKKE